MTKNFVSVAQRDRDLAEVASAADVLGLEYRSEGVSVFVRIAPDRELRFSAGGGFGCLRATAFVDDVEDATRVAVVDDHLRMLRRVAAR